MINILHLTKQLLIFANEKRLREKKLLFVKRLSYPDNNIG